MTGTRFTHSKQREPQFFSWNSDLTGLTFSGNPKNRWEMFVFCKKNFTGLKISNGPGNPTVPRSLLNAGPDIREGVHSPDSRMYGVAVKITMRLKLNTHTYTELIMATKTISITEEAYDRLKALKKDEKTSFSDVIVKYYPVRRKLSDVLAELGDCTDLADHVEKVSREMRKGRMREVTF